VDRPRIAGGIWKFLSTDLDTFYHRPDSALMLAQPADHVIGFASAADAEEAGYLPGPSVAAGLDVATLRGASAPTVVSANTGRTGTGQAGSSSPGSVTLSIPWSQIPRDVQVIIQTTDVLADAIQNAPSRAEQAVLRRLLVEFRLWGTIDGRPLASLTGNTAAFADRQRWLPILQPQLPLPIPVPLAMGAPAADYPWNWSVYRWLDGAPAGADVISDPVEFATTLA